MAEAVVQFLLERLTSLGGRELGLLLGFDGDKKKLQSMFTAIKATLQDAEEKQFSNETIKDWLRKLKDAAYDLDDIMDECAYEARRLEYPGLIFGLSHKLKHAAFRYKIAKKMKKLCERLDEIAKEKEQFHLTQTTQEKTSAVPDSRLTISSITEPHVYGREKDTEKIVDFLIGEADTSPSQNLSVYPILGLGGLGKTTLAQLIFKDERIVNHFKIRIWVCVSEDFSLKRMMKAIIEAASGKSCEDLDPEPLHRKLRDLLQGKIYLLVLDDVWDEEQENWLKLKSLLTCGGKGASILVTTRLSKVAAIMGTIPPHQLSILSDRDCWDLFRYRAFAQDEEEPEELVVIGREIVKKCGGVPLAAKALGGLLRFERMREVWLNVKESNLLELSPNENSIMPALRLSYLNLPVKLRQCFAYCAIFPKDERMRKHQLIQLWMANGFISSDGLLDVEGDGDRAWHELYWRSFFQDLETDEFGKVTSFKMHDLVHDLAQFVGQEICCKIKDNNVSIFSERIRHLSLHGLKKEMVLLQKFKSLRTCISTYRDWFDDVYLNFDFLLFPSHVLKCYSLRILDFERRKKLPSSIGHLKHLRYLNLSKGRFKTLPGSICELWNLQILNLDNCQLLQKLPKSFIHLKVLQQLSLNSCYALSSLPPGIGKVTSLRILSMYIVGKERGFRLVELGPLNLKGVLHIRHLGKVKSVEDAKEANMSSKQLSNLILEWDESEESELQENVEEILEVLQPDTQQLQRLDVRGYKGAHFPDWMSSPPLKYLTDLGLSSCLQFPPIWKLPSLKRLRIDNMIHVTYLYEESCHNGIVTLESLCLRNLPNLIKLSREDGENMFPRLSILDVRHCPKLVGLPVLNAIEQLSIHDCIGLMSLPQGSHSLKRLRIFGCIMFNVWAGFQCLTSLEYLYISECREVEGLHEALQHMTALKELFLMSLPNLESLPDCFGNLPLLRYLAVYDCSKLTCLPSSLSILSSLEELTIKDCHPELEKRCEKETGEDWPKIAHIPRITVGGKTEWNNKVL